MNLQTFINRPILSGVLSVFVALLGIIGLVQLPVEQFPEIAPPTVRVSATYTGANAESRRRPVGRSHQRSGEYQLYDLFCHQQRHGHHQCLFPSRYRPRHGSSECAEPHCLGTGCTACGSNPLRHYSAQESEQHGEDCGAV